VVTYEPDLMRNFSVRGENIFIEEKKEWFGGVKKYKSEGKWRK
jgi:hypothetical protein